MKNGRLKWLLSEQGFTQETLAKAVGMGRCRLNQVLANTPGRGGISRPKVARWIATNFPPTKARELFQTLGWDEKGALVERSPWNALAGGPPQTEAKEL